MRDPSKRRIKKIFFRAVYWELILYTLTAGFGYISFMDKTHRLVIDREPLPNMWDNDYMMLAGRCGTFLLIIIGVPVISAPCRN